MEPGILTSKRDPCGEAGIEVSIDPAAWHRARLLWVGAICSVEEVVAHATGQRAVLKHMHAEHRTDPGIAARCLNEALILRFLHAEKAPGGVPRLFAVGFLPNGCPGLLMELLGESLAAQLDTAGPGASGEPSIALQLHVGSQVAAALASIHSRGIIHRDVRPDNILFGLRPDPASAAALPDIFLIDFGLAKVQSREDLLPISTGDEDILGTDEYMAPEQWESAKRVTGAADVYSLGVVLYRLASGRLPFTDPRRQILMYQHLVTPPEPLPRRVPRPLARLIHAMLAKRSADRPGARECADILRSLQ